MADDNDSNGDGGDSTSTDALGKEQRQNSKTVEKGTTVDGSESVENSKGTTADGNAGEEGGYGFVPPSADSDGGESGNSSDGGSGGSDE